MRYISRCVVAILLVLFVTAGVCAQQMLPETISDRGVQLIMKLEGFAAKPHWDVNGYAVGYGSHTWNGRKVTRKYPRVVTPESAAQQLFRELAVCENVVRQSVSTDLSQDAYDALVSVVYNLGRVNTSILTRMESGEDVTVNDFLTTATVRGRTDWRLHARRLREFLLFTGDYDSALMSFKSRQDVRNTLSLVRSLSTGEMRP